MFAYKIIEQGELVRDDDGNLVLTWKFRKWIAPTMENLKLQIVKFLGRNF